MEITFYQRGSLLEPAASRGESGTPTRGDSGTTPTTCGDSGTPTLQDYCGGMRVEKNESWRPASCMSRARSELQRPTCKGFTHHSIQQIIYYYQNEPRTYYPTARMQIVTLFMSVTIGNQLIASHAHCRLPPRPAPLALPGREPCRRAALFTNMQYSNK